ncbi:O-antigen ligase family protein [Dorea sp. YH-dor228]|uniref:O-antigen ligase family protein n=1 Tax=Dorea sp. YH-dor228 TaxID=3151120 RepID=UPI00324273F3
MSYKKLLISKKELIMMVLILIQFLPTNGTSVRPYLFVLILMLFSSLKKTEMRLDIFCCIYAITTVLSYIIHYYAGTLGLLIAFIAFFIAAPFIVKCNVNSMVIFEKTIRFIVICFTVYALLCIIESFAGINVYDLLFQRSVSLTGANEPRYGFYRSHGLSTVSINNAMFLNMAWLLAAYRMYTGRKKVGRVFQFWIIGAAMLLTMSRAAIVVGVVSQLILARKKGIAWASKKLLLAIIIAVMGAIFYSKEVFSLVNFVEDMFAPIIANITGKDNNTVGGVGERLLLWSWVYEKVKDNLLFGMGYDTPFRYSYSGTSGIYSWTAIKSSIENQWLYILYQSGIIGLSGFIVFVLGCIKNVSEKINTLFESGRGITFKDTMQVLTIGYIIELFSCAAAEEIQFFYILLALFSVYKKLTNGYLRK